MRNFTALIILLLIGISGFSQNLIWDTLNTGTTKNINDIYFHSPDTGYIVGDDYLFKKTTDGGITWADLTAPMIGEKPGNNGKIVGIDFHTGVSFNSISLDTALHLSWEKPYHGIYTKDEGSSYSSYPFGYFPNNDSNLFCFNSGFSILPVNRGSGSVQLITYGQNCSGDAVYSSYNDGFFSSIHVDTSISYQPGGFTDVAADSFSAIFAHSNGYLLRINTAFSTPDSIFLDSSGVSAVAYAGNHIWYAATKFGVNKRGFWNMYVSNDSGKTFSVDSSLVPNIFYPIVNDFSFLKNGVGLAGCNSNGKGVILIKNANSWDFYSAPQPINKVKLFTNGTAYAAGDSGLVMKTVITTSINEVKKANSQLTVYPNPVMRILHLEKLEQIKIKQLFLTDISGKEIRRFNPKNSSLDVSDISSGIYLLQIVSEEGRFAKKVIIE